MRIARRAGTVALVAVVLAVAGCRSVPGRQPAPAFHIRSVPQGVTLLEIRGMTCPIVCVRQVESMLGAAPGVRSVRVDFASRTAQLELAPGTDPGSVLGHLRPPYSARVLPPLSVSR